MRSGRAGGGGGVARGRALVTCVLVLTGIVGACSDGSEVTGPGVPISLMVTLPAPTAQAMPGIADAFAAADEVFVFVGAFPDGLDTLRLLDNLEERAVRDADDLLAELARLGTVLQAGWLPLGEEGTVRLSLLGPEEGVSVVALVLVAVDRRALFAGASGAVRLQVAPPPRVEISLTPLAWDTQATPDVVTLPGPGAVVDLSAVGTFFTGDLLGPLPPEATEWRSLDGRVAVIDPEAGVVRALVSGTALVEVENVLHGFSLADDGGPENGQVVDTVRIQVGGG